MASEIRVNQLQNRSGLGTVSLTNTGAVVAGIVTATSFSGDGSGLSGIDATSLKDSGGNVKVQANTSGAVITGIVTATSFSGDVTGDLTGNADSSTTATSAQGLTGTPNVVVGIVTATEIAGVSTIGVTTVTATTLTVNGNNYPSTGPLSNRNLIINGDCRINQRNSGTGSTTTTGGNTYGPVDRFITRISRDDWEGELSKETVSVNGGEFVYCHRVKTTTPETTVDGYNQIVVEQRLEGHDLQHLAQGTATAKPVTLSFWVRSSISGGGFVVRIYRNASGGRILNKTYTINSADTWEYKTVTWVGDTTDTILDNSSEGLRVSWQIAAGSGWTSGSQPTTWTDYADGIWASGHTNNTFMTTDNATWDLTGVQLEVGEVDTPFEHRSYADQLARCQRYYINGNDYHWFYDIQTSQSEASLRTHVNFPVTMRANPTVVGTIGYTANNSSTTLTTQWSRPNGAAFYPTQSQTTGIVAISGYTASAEI